LFYKIFVSETINFVTTSHLKPNTMADDEVDISDISNSPAFLALNDLLADGTLTQAQVEFYKSKYAKLHEVVLQTYENEKTLLRKAKDLNEDLRKERLAAEEIVGRDKEIRDELDHTRTEFAKAEAEVVMCEERDAMLNLEVAELERQKDEISKEKEDKEREAIEALRPRLEALNLSIQQLTQEIDSSKAQSQKLSAEKSGLEQKAAGLEEAVRTMSAEVEGLRQQMLKIRTEPGPHAL
jgi:chromosome segregation ATPase